VADDPDPAQQLDLTSQSLALHLTRDADGNPQPTRLAAQGSPAQPVVALQPTTTFRSHQLTLDLAPAPEVTAANPTRGSGTSVPVPPTSDSTETNIQITRLRALGDVRVNLTEPGNEAILTAHALDADPRVNRLALFGQDENHFATLTRSDAALAGVHLVLLENEQSAHALGPGTFSAAVDPDDPEARLNVTWQTSMDFDNAAGTALFLGRVDAASTSAVDDTSLTNAHRLALEFVPQDFDTSNSDAPDTRNASGEISGDISGGVPGGALDIRRVTATSDPDDADQQVQFTAQTFDENAEPNARPLTRLTLISTDLRFINQPPNLTNRTTIDDHITVEQVRVPTRGRLLLEDYRSPPADDSDVSDDGPVNLAGRGVTVFAWEKQLLLDAQANDLRLEGDVFMLHRPPPGSAPENGRGEDGLPEVAGVDGEPVKLDAQRLVADLTETGGLGAYLAGDAPRAQVRRINADGRVRVARADASIVADHLEYDESKRQAEFWAEPRRAVELTQDRTTTTARRFTWDLDTNRFTALDPTPGVVPVE
ncbi:MAG: hypothetical protein AAFX76_06680, partial [Planctomycetota bacterium]